MPSLASSLVAAAAVVIFALGSLHLLFTFWGRRLWPRDAALQLQMCDATPRLTRDTTMWRAWLGFNASHSLGAMLFGVVYATLALDHAPVLFGTRLLALTGLALLLAYAVLGWRYWFRVPLAGICLATALFGSGLALGWQVAP